MKTTPPHGETILQPAAKVCSVGFEAPPREGASAGLNTKPYLFKLMHRPQGIVGPVLHVPTPPRCKIKHRGRDASRSVKQPADAATTVRELALWILMSAEQLASTAIVERSRLDFAISDAGGLGRFRVNVFHAARLAWRWCCATSRAQHVADDSSRTERCRRRVRDLAMPEARPDPDGGRHRFRQVDDAGGDGRPPQRAPRPSHILTIEDPIEFVHTNKRSIVNQREVGTDTKSATTARCARAMRAAPDVILIGEMRDARDHGRRRCNLARAPGTWRSRPCTRTTRGEAMAARSINLFPREPAATSSSSIMSLYLRAIMAQRLVMQVRTAGASRRSRCMLNTPHVQPS
jgi:twitching motility protein PilU